MCGDGVHRAGPVAERLTDARFECPGVPLDHPQARLELPD
jgi:hypothetical protein